MGERKILLKFRANKGTETQEATTQTNKKRKKPNGKIKLHGNVNRSSTAIQYCIVQHLLFKDMNKQGETNKTDALPVVFLMTGGR